MMDSLGDLFFYCSTYFMAKGYTEDTNNRTNVFFYELTHTGFGDATEKELGIPHGADVEILFGLTLLNPDSTHENRELVEL